MFKKNPRTQVALDIEIWKGDKFGWHPVKNLGMRDDIYKKVIPQTGPVNRFAR